MKISISVPDKCTNWLSKNSYDPLYGARPVKRAIQNFLLNPLAKEIISGGIKENETVKLDLVDKNGKVTDSLENSEIKIISNH